MGICKRYTRYASVAELWDSEAKWDYKKAMTKTIQLQMCVCVCVSLNTQRKGGENQRTKYILFWTNHFQ